MNEMNVVNIESQEKIHVLEGHIETIESEKFTLQNELAVSRGEVTALGEQVGSISSTVGTLEKLSKIDPELLKKYSKVFFLSEHYVPKSLSDIDPQYAFETGKVLRVHTEIKSRLEAMLRTMNNQGIETKVASAYRSFGEQDQLKNSYKFTYGSGTANQFSAEQGYSEHQLGTTVDFTTPAVGGSFVNFQKSTAYDWLLDNAYRYGFVLSYPENNTYYTYEPWHWRFVGTSLAGRLHDENKYFYDLDQREIDVYLVEVFD